MASRASGEVVAERPVAAEARPGGSSGTGGATGGSGGATGGSAGASGGSAGATGGSAGARVEPRRNRREPPAVQVLRARVPRVHDRHGLQGVRRLLLVPRRSYHRESHEPPPVPASGQVREIDAPKAAACVAGRCVMGFEAIRRR
ncbi:MAG: hypothetical protein U0263_40155 [Polyangiaceae bacterium]